MMLEDHNFFGPTVSGYRIEAYRALPQGWSAAPSGTWSDLFMWRKFLGSASLTVGSRFAITSVHFPSSLRRDWPLDRRLDEIARYAILSATENGRDALRQSALAALAREHVDQERHAAALQVDLASLKARFDEVQTELRSAGERLME
jgi:hypothetical protein